MKSRPSSRARNIRVVNGSRKQREINSWNCLVALDNGEYLPITGRLVALELALVVLELAIVALVVVVAS